MCIKLELLDLTKLIFNNQKNGQSCTFSACHISGCGLHYLISVVCIYFEIKLNRITFGCTIAFPFMYVRGQYCGLALVSTVAVQQEVQVSIPGSIRGFPVRCLHVEKDPATNSKNIAEEFWELVAAAPKSQI